MPLFGIHMSIAGGYHNALLQAHQSGCECVQLFTHAPNQWNGRERNADCSASCENVTFQLQ